MPLYNTENVNLIKSDIRKMVKFVSPKKARGDQIDLPPMIFPKIYFIYILIRERVKPCSLVTSNNTSKSYLSRKIQ